MIIYDILLAVTVYLTNLEKKRKYYIHVYPAMLPQSSSARVLAGGLKIGALAGFVAAWSISTAIAASELGLGLPVGTFYAVMGISLGQIDFVAAAFLGFGLHLVTSALLGAAIGIAASRFSARMLSSPYRSALLGMGAGMAVWLILFLPLTVLLVQPAIASVPAQTTVIGEMERAAWSIALGAIAFHLVWGAIFGYVASSLVRIHAFRTAQAGGALQ
jgi:hypothetical protein